MKSADLNSIAIRGLVLVVVTALVLGLRSQGEDLRLARSIPGEDQTVVTNNALFVPGEPSDLLLSAEAVSDEEAILIRREASLWPAQRSGQVAFELSISDLRKANEEPILRLPLDYECEAADWSLELARGRSSLGLAARDDRIELAVPWSEKAVSLSRACMGSALVPTPAFLDQATLIGTSDQGKALVWQLDAVTPTFPSIRLATRRSDGLILRMAGVLAAPSAHLRLDLRLMQESLSPGQESAPVGEDEYVRLANDGASHDGD